MAKERKVKVKPLKRKCIKGIVIGSKLINIGALDLLLRKCRLGLGKEELVKAGETFEIIKGYSAIVVENTFDIGNVTFTIFLN